MRNIYLPVRCTVLFLDLLSRYLSDYYHSTRDSNNIVIIYCPLFLKYSMRTLRDSDSSPKSRTTTQEHPTTFLGLASLSSLQSPAHSPSCLESGTLMRLMLCSAQRASTNLERREKNEIYMILDEKIIVIVLLFRIV